MGERLAEMIALAVGQAEPLELDRLHFALDLLADRRDAGLAADFGDRAETARIARIARGGGAEIAVDLDEIDLEAAQIVERGRPGAEIVATGPDWPCRAPARFRRRCCSRASGRKD